MIEGLERLQAARGILDQPGPPTSEVDALVSAAEECWSASIDGADWSVDLRVRTTTLQQNMFRYGSIRRSVEQMSATERQQLRQEILDLVAAAERSARRH